jgi:cell division protein FtsQ
MTISANHIKRIAVIILWLGLATAAVMLLVSGVKHKSSSICKSLQINIKGEGDHFFIDKTDVVEILKKVHGGKLEGTRVESINTKKMELELRKDQWIERAELYFDKNNRLFVEIEEKNPIARVFNVEGNSFYLDHKLRQLPLTNRHPVRLPVFTGFPTSTVVMSKADSILLMNIKSMSVYVNKDSFLMAMIEQININAQREFELIPKIGDQLILFGTSKDMEVKFKKLRLFYQQVLPIHGWTKYSKINLKYKDQIVASLRGREDIKYDSLQTMQMIKAMAEYSAKKSADTAHRMITDQDSVDVSMIMSSIAREEPEEYNTTATLTPTKPATQTTLPTKLKASSPSTKNEKSTKTSVTPNKTTQKTTAPKQAPPKAKSVPKEQKNQLNDYRK